MISLSLGIVDSRRGPFNLAFARRTFTDVSDPISPTAGEPIALGNWDFPGVSTYNEGGYAYFDVGTSSGDISSVIEFGIVSSSSNNPIYTDAPQIINVPVEAQSYTFSSSGLKYLRVYGEINTEYFYSSEISFDVKELNFTQISISPYGTPGVDYGELIGLECQLIYNGSLSEAGFYINDVTETTFTDIDPYWKYDSLSPIIVTPDYSSLIPTISYTYDWSNTIVDRYLFIRCYIIVDGVRHWSGYIFHS